MAARERPSLERVEKPAGKQFMKAVRRYGSVGWGVEASCFWSRRNSVSMFSPRIWRARSGEETWRGIRVFVAWFFRYVDGVP